MKKFTLMLMACLMVTLGYAQRPLKSSRTLAPRPMKKVNILTSKQTTPQARAPKRAESDYVIITERPEGEAKTYKRSGDDYYVSGDYAYQGTQSGKVTIVFNGNDVYFLNPVAGFITGAWVKGTLSEDGKTITMPLFQNLSYNSQYDACIMTAFSTIDSDGYFVPDKTVTEVTYTIGENTITLNGCDEEHFLGAFWTDDDSWQGFGEWNTVLTEYVPNYTLITPPEDLATTEMPLSGMDVEGSELTGTVKVGMDGSDFYVQGLVPDLPEIWLKGTLEDGVVSIPVTYIGSFEGYEMFAAGYGQEGLAPIELIYDSETGTYELDGYLLINSDEDAFDYNSTLITYYTGLFLGERPAMVQVPDGLETKILPYAGNDVNGYKVEGSVEVGFDGNDVYIKGLIAEVPEGWIKGSLNDDKTTATFPIQYVGQDEETAASVYLVGGEEAVEPVVFSYDADSNIFTSQGYIFSNGRKDIIYYYSGYESGLIIGSVYDAVWVAGDQGYTNQQEITEIIIDPEVTFGTLSNGSNTMTPKYYNSGTSLRLYADNSLTITSTKTIASIEFIFAGNENQMQLTADKGKYQLDGTTGIWTGEESEIAFSVPNIAGKQARIQRINVTYFDYSTTLVTVPEGLTIEAYYFKGTDTYFENEDTRYVIVGFDGDDVYMQGLSKYKEDGWVKGTIKDGVVTIPNWLLGSVMSFFGSYDLAFGGATMTYDAEAGLFTCEEYKSFSDEYAMDEYADVTISKIVEKAGTPEQPMITDIDIESSYPAMSIDLPIVDTEGNPMVPEKLSYQFFTNIEGTVAELVFDPSEYRYLTEEMTVIPYTFNDDYDIYTGGSVVYINQANYQDWNEIGVKSIYTGGGETHESEIFWYTIKEVDGINTISTTSNADAPAYNLQGMRVKNPTQKGIYIRNGRKEVIK